MKQKDLKAPFSFQSRHPLLHEGVLFVPAYYFAHSALALPPLEEVFGRMAPLYMELCAGNGDWVIEKALQQPEVNWIAVELRFDRIRKIWAKMHNRGVKNLLLVCGEGLTFCTHYLPPAILEGVFINFPDPWPKARHGKHRLMRPAFLEQMAHVLKPEALLTLTTDDETYLKEALGYLQEAKAFSPCFPFPGYAPLPADYGSSWFEQLWRQKGKSLHYTQFLVNHVPADPLYRL